ncbi:uncharacterized protein LOC130452973 [Diorhabda sublineata]|uniref:uncharacterized protein LOC130452973 n=1 Tax=Diorhabda sublineata TaxID=1163346 RepID=UPI0024E13D44|nr:uncharacterized protein LOC130452973 [Diorhabda sublineata]
MLLLFVFLASLFCQIRGHGMMLDPPGRSSLWRFNDLAPINYNDNQNFCGGFYVQHSLNNGSCGVCGDIYNDEHPQDNENTGKYGQGIVVKEYEGGSVIDVFINVTANHLGYFLYSLCELEDPNAPESGEDCFESLFLEDGSTNFTVTEDISEVTNRVVLPNIDCPRCVLRWTYITGNNWGLCDDDVWRRGCGPQENFRSCSDISITATELTKQGFEME